MTMDMIHLELRDKVSLAGFADEEGAFLPARGGSYKVRWGQSSTYRGQEVQQGPGKQVQEAT